MMICQFAMLVITRGYIFLTDPSLDSPHGKVQRAMFAAENKTIVHQWLDEQWRVSTAHDFPIKQRHLQGISMDLYGFLDSPIFFLSQMVEPSRKTLFGPPMPQMSCSNVPEKKRWASGNRNAFRKCQTGAVPKYWKPRNADTDVIQCTEGSIACIDGNQVPVSELVKTAVITGGTIDVFSHWLGD